MCPSQTVARLEHIHNCVPAIARDKSCCTSWILRVGRVRMLGHRRSGIRRRSVSRWKSTASSDRFIDLTLSFHPTPSAPTPTPSLSLTIDSLTRQVHSDVYSTRAIVMFIKFVWLALRHVGGGLPRGARWQPSGVWKEGAFGMCSSLRR